MSEALAMRFHEAYERLAPQFGYSTREASAKPWAEVPANNKALMIAACAELLALPDDDSVVDDVTAINALSRHVLDARFLLAERDRTIEELRQGLVGLRHRLGDGPRWRTDTALLSATSRRWRCKKCSDCTTTTAKLSARIAPSMHHRQGEKPR